MPLELIKAKTIAGLDQLDFDKRNYVRWSESALDAFLYAGTREYVLNEITKPKAGDLDLATWTKNNNLAQAGIHLNIAPTERDYLRDRCTSRRVPCLSQRSLSTLSSGHELHLRALWLSLSLSPPPSEVSPSRAT
jgi:hypothetical protein